MELEEKVQVFWEKVQSEYSVLVEVGGVAENRDYYIFQTNYYFNPDLMIVGINPGGDYRNGNRWICPPNLENNYVSDSHPWFQTLRKIFGYPNNENLKPFLENCVGSNTIFINTGNVKKIPNSTVLGPSLIRELVSEIIEPKHIVALGRDAFYSLKNNKISYKDFGDFRLEYSFRGDIPICFIPNPSRTNSIYFNSLEKLNNWQKGLEWFLTQL